MAHNPFMALAASDDSDSDDETPCRSVAHTSGDQGDNDEPWLQPPPDKKAKKKQRKDQRRQQVENAAGTSVQDLTRRMINLTKGKTSTLSSRVSKALELGQWEDALVCLVAMHYAEQAPKLGSVQR
jgi:hypothetical protein